MSKYKIIKCDDIPQLIGVIYESVIIKDMTLLNLVKQIANDVANIKINVADLKVRMTKVEDRLDKLENKVDSVIKLNNLRTE
jgi:hypothetical protein